MSPNFSYSFSSSSSSPSSSATSTTSSLKPDSDDHYRHINNGNVCGGGDSVDDKKLIQVDTSATLHYSMSSYMIIKPTATTKTLINMMTVCSPITPSLLWWTIVLVLLSSTAITVTTTNAEPVMQQPTYLDPNDGNINPYTIYSRTTTLKTPSLYSSSSELWPHYTSNDDRTKWTNFSTTTTAATTTITTTSTTISPSDTIINPVRRSPKWSTDRSSSSSSSSQHHRLPSSRRRQILMANATKPSEIVENLTASASSLHKEKRQLVQTPEQTIVQQVQQIYPDSGVGINTIGGGGGGGGVPTQHYQCDTIIHADRFIIESPYYPSTYPVNRDCTYYVAKYRNDVCQIELTITDMDIEDTPRCTADYLDLGGGQEERLCGLMLRNTRRYIMFPSNGSYIKINFHSDGQNARPYRGFSAEIRQVPESCYYPYYNNDGGVLYPNGTKVPQQVIHSVYGQRLYPTTRPPGYYTPGQRPITNAGQPQFGQTLPPYAMPTPGSIGSNAQNQTPIYLASYCDVYLGDMHGELRSPSYPFGYPTNHTCIYTIKRAYTDVCQLELIFHHLDIQTPDTKRDLTDVCYGDYLELPDHSRICGYYNQAMSKDHVLKKFYLFPETSSYLFLQFVSDHHPTPDGSGFWIEARQLRNTCGQDFGTRYSGSSGANCDRILSGKESTVHRLYTPNYPQPYGPRQQCVYLITPSDSTTCEFELDFVQFNLENPSPTSITTNMVMMDSASVCNKDFLQLPDRTRICGQMHFRRIFPFPKYHDRTAMMYFNSDEKTQQPGYEIVLRQLPNTCNGTIGGGGWEQNVYVVNDPNDNRRQHPTPVFTYHNASGFQPIWPQPQTFNVGGKTIGTKIGTILPGGSSSGAAGGGGKLGPSYSIVPPSVYGVNDPRNVDSSGTIPLYYANGSLATRIPPLKPVDMIHFLKRGKTLAQKTGNFGSITSSSKINGGAYAGFDGRSNTLLNDAASSSTNRRLQTSDTGFQSSDRLMVSPRGGGGNMLPGVTELQPAYNCDQVISRSVEYIRSPNFPSNYPPVTRCIYTILKADNTVCQMRLQLLSMDLEYTSGCKSDYFQIETTGEKICGRLGQPETRVLNHYGHSRDIRLIFNSDRQNTASGFEVRIEQIPNSCDDNNGLNRMSNMNNVSFASIMSASSGRSFGGNTNLPTTRSARLENGPSSFGGQSPTPPTSPLAAPLLTTTVNGVGGFGISNMTMSSTNPGRICRTTTLMETYFESDNFPAPYPTNTECWYKVFRANRNVCRLEIELLNFDVGNEMIDFNSGNFALSSSSSSASSTSLLTTSCPNDFVEIDHVKYCGRKSTGQKIAVNFPRLSSEVNFRFLSVSPDTFSGFRIKVRQIDENCRQSSITTGMVDQMASMSDEMGGDFSPATIESCPKQSNDVANTATMINGAITEEVIRIQSPKFGLATNVGYEPFLDCDYVLQRVSRNVCALEVRFEQFSLEESRACTKDYLEFNNQTGSRFCGKLPINTIRTFDFPTDTMRIRFHSDATRNDAGFAMILRQIRC